MEKVNVADAIETFNTTKMTKLEAQNKHTIAASRPSKPKLITRRLKSYPMSSVSQSERAVVRSNPIRMYSSND